MASSFQESQDVSSLLLSAKSAKNHTFHTLAQLLPGRNEVSVASLLLSSHPPPTRDEIQILSNELELPQHLLQDYFTSAPDRGKTAIDMPPKEPLMYRLYEVLLNYGRAYKAVMNELFGDGIMSAIAFSTKVEKEVVKDEKTGEETTWAVITMRGKWLPYSKF
ncbi:cyanate lyase C-terminal domain-containing protein [Kalaharituber pfeilii]|nr:cyanate lyase C-terminal domain-containing protein [Kalaharituber pfeilii]